MLPILGAWPQQSGSRLEMGLSKGVLEEGDTLSGAKSIELERPGGNLGESVRLLSQKQMQD